MTQAGHIAKRSLDIVVSAVGLALLALPFAALALAIRLDDSGPVFFRQERVGKGGKPFRVWKFRTMVVGAESLGARHGFVENDPRVTRVGHFLRSTGVDELPQLVNVLMGQMSLVGPRPTLLHQVTQYAPQQARRLAVRPGITGLALIRGRNDIPWSKRIEYDLEYLEKWSFLLDLRILLTTVKVVALRQGMRMDQSAEEVEDFHSGDQVG